MNERIRELAVQARKYAWENETHWSADAEREALFEQKFAELIVRECANVALEQKKWVEDMKAHNPHDETWNQARIQQSQHIVEKIKQHFGVEE